MDVMNYVNHRKPNEYDYDNARYGSYEELKEKLLYKKIKSWTAHKLVLEDDTVITLEKSDSDCCAYAEGEFKDVELDAVITGISISEVVEGEAYGDILNKSTVTLFHNQNPIALADMEAGHNGYYYSVGSLVIENVHYPVVEA